MEQRRLVAIMFTDIVVFTATFQEDERKAVAQKDKHRKVFKNCTNKFEGEIIQFFGDGTLSIFNSTFNAVKWAIELQ